MRSFAFLPLIFGPLLCLVVVLDAFQTIILPRRPSGRMRITRLFYRVTWRLWMAIANRFSDRTVREQFYSVFGPFSLLLLLVLWAAFLILGFGLTFYGLGTPFTDSHMGAPRLASDLLALRTDLYVSGTTLFTLGLGDVTPQSHMARALVVLESGTGLGFVALVIGYLPVIYQAFSRREINVALLDGRAGSPPTASELLRRHSHEGGEAELVMLLSEWERWAAEILESHISYPILCYYRSQHDNQSWLAALVTVLDSCALLITTGKDLKGVTVRQAQLTFVIARHALIDLGRVFHVESGRSWPEPPLEDRLPEETFSLLCDSIGSRHMELCGAAETIIRLTAIRALYEPHAAELAGYLCMSLPLWVAEPRKADAWKKVDDLKRPLGMV